MYVRTIVDVPAGAQLTVCHAQAYDPRPVRQAALLQVRRVCWWLLGCTQAARFGCSRAYVAWRNSPWAHLQRLAFRAFRTACVPACGACGPRHAQRQRARRAWQNPGGRPHLTTARRRPCLRMQERGIKCACERCSEPLAKSTDRFLEGVWCLNCTTDVLLAVPPGTPEAEAAAAVYEEQARGRCTRGCVGSYFWSVGAAPNGCARKEKGC